MDDDKLTETRDEQLPEVGDGRREAGRDRDQRREPRSKPRKDGERPAENLTDVICFPKKYLRLHVATGLRGW